MKVSPNARPLEQPAPRGMPRWRQRQSLLPVGEKIEIIGKLILETRRFEQIKKSCRPSATS